MQTWAATSEMPMIIAEPTDNPTGCVACHVAGFPLFEPWVLIDEVGRLTTFA